MSAMHLILNKSSFHENGLAGFVLNTGLSGVTSEPCCHACQTHSHKWIYLEASRYRTLSQWPETFVPLCITSWSLKPVRVCQTALPSKLKVSCVLVTVNSCFTENIFFMQYVFISVPPSSSRSFPLIQFYASFSQSLEKKWERAEHSRKKEST